MGRPMSKEKIDDKMVVNVLMESIRVGVPYYKAAERAKIHRSTFKRWMDTAEEQISKGIESKYTTLYNNIKKAEGDAIAVALAEIRTAGKKHWTEIGRAHV